MHYLRLITRWHIALLIAVYSCAAVAQPIRPDLDFKTDLLKEKRELFAKAWYAAREGHITHSQKLAVKLKNYPLYPDLEAEWLSFRPREARFLEALDFIKQHSNTTAANKVVSAWQSKAVRYKKWHWFEQMGDPKTLPTEAQCQFTLTLLNSKHRHEEGKSYGKDLWLFGKSQPKECDAVFNQLTRIGVINDDLIWQRTALAVASGRKRLAEYLLKQLDQSYQDIGQAMIDFRFSRHQSISDEYLTDPRSIYFLTDIFKRLARQDSRTTAQRWLTLVAEGKLTDDTNIRREIGKRIFLSRRSDSQYWLAQLNPSHLDETISDWLLRSAIAVEDWPQIANLTNKMVELHGIESLDERQRYWRARATDELGDFSAAQHQYKALAEERSFYGFMSADITGSVYQLNHHAIEVDNQEIADIANQKGMRRLREWLLLEEHGKADLEWYFISLQLSQREKLAATRLAQIWQQPNLAIKAAISARYWDDVEIRFPLNYRDRISHAIDGIDIEDSLVMGLARQESAFDEHAKSPVGAMGLMQLMPATARQIAKTIGVNFIHTDLLDGETNLKLGSNYLDQLINRYAGNAILATAAYNAGPYRVDSWLAEAQNCQRIDSWIESVPYQETRDYVQNVLTYKVIYDTLLGRPTRLLSPGQEILGAASQFSAID